MAGSRQPSTASLAAAGPTVGDLLTKYRIEHSQMPKASLTPVLTTVSVVGDDSNPDGVYAESADGVVRLVIGGVKVGEHTVYALMSSRYSEYGLSRMPLVGGGVDADSDVLVRHRSTGVVTGSLDADQVKTVNANIIKAFQSAKSSPSSDPPLFPEDKLAASTGFACVGFTPPTLGTPAPHAEHGSGFGDVIFLPFTKKSKPVWANVNQALGPVFVRRMGITMEYTGDDFELLLWIDGTLGMSSTASKQSGDQVGLTLEIVGFRVGFTTATQDYGWENIKAHGPQGFGIDFKAGQVEFGGGMIYKEDADYDPLIEGGLIVSVPKISLLVEAAWAHALGHGDSPNFTSLFVFTRVQKPQSSQQMPPAPAIGVPIIPGVITLTGFCLGIGFNSQLKVPGPADVKRFPLLIGLTPQAQDVKIPQGPLDALEMLTREPENWVTPQDSAYWLAVGLQAVLIDFISCSALFVLSFKGSLSGALIGTLDMSVANIASFRAAMEAELADDLVAIGASLTDDSFFITEKAKLKGALDVYVFTGGAHSGEFVITAGGYRPGFTPPKYWPHVLDDERIGLEWKINDWMSAKAQFYWMVSPHGMMLGGDFSVDLSKDIPSGSVVGWSRFSFDVTAQYHPFFMLFTATASAGFRLKLLLATVSVEAGYRLDGWLPPVGGRFEIELPFGIRIGVAFGSELESGLKELSWDEFVAQKLPDAGHRLQIAPESGMLTVPGTPSDLNANAPGPWIVSLHGFTFSTRCVVPSTAFRVNSPNSYSAQPDDRDAEASGPGRKLNVRPLGKAKGAGLTSTHTVMITHGVNGPPVALEEMGWKVEYLTEGLPQALWGEPLDAPDASPSIHGTGLVDDQYTGIRVTIPDARLSGSLPAIHAADLSHEPAGPDTCLPLDPIDTTPPNHSPAQADAIAEIATGIATTAAAPRVRLDAALSNCRLAHPHNTAPTTRDYSTHTDDPLTRYAGRVRNGLYNSQPLQLAG